MNDRFTRTKLILGEEGIAKLRSSRVAVFGIGGVGGYAVEALVRAGIGAIDLIDKDVVDVTNINRQIIATMSTVGRDKVEVMKERISDIAPDIRVNAHKRFFLPETEFDFSGFDYVVDAIDTVTAKLDLIVRARAAGVPVISSMGTGNKLDPTRFEVTTIDKTSVCPLAKVMRRELRRRGISDLKVVYSREEPAKQAERGVPASVSFVPPAAGLILAGEVVKDLIKW
ncbi:tRNA threonylcarbamoyladenosine dehydratase [Anaerovorax odorimutans]|uniref:tRNA threonylcarbamoyladenosine dehydratase n=1 Tax=Anaerovorax odorimutans TaxID=109327 RepID=A0ABT1RRD5_9FIRM|nr:tRNA threonylcarbamoyladenosine dehydratase [Anaerovorax odorimutans]MCQ4637758.1 tRNA threonylcarbamoyladenosine dehydratase [Anaerovorax odorimutans]